MKTIPKTVQAITGSGNLLLAGGKKDEESPNFSLRSKKECSGNTWKIG